MDSLSLQHQLELRELLAFYDNIMEEIDEVGMDKEKAQRLYNIYDAMSKVLGEAWKEIPELNNLGSTMDA